ncbi:hypothetical protein DFJ77DRAFT_448982 [Powellomyces hirtus]|nr:hypothetical protein DFJ77DRAFT_448982 [Powellomyces hirtus]
MEAKDAVQETAVALESLTKSLNKLRILSSKSRTRLTDAAVHAILRWLDPLEYHLVAPLVCKQWRNCIRRGDTGGWKPRVVLLNLRIVLGTPNAHAHDDDQEKEGNVSAVARKPQTLITQPAPLNHWTVLPSQYCKATQTCMAGEGMVVQTTLENTPRDPEKVAEFLNGILAMLIKRVRWWCNRTDGSSTAGACNPLTNAPNVSLVPWQVTIMDALKGDQKLAFGEILARFSPRVVEVHQPPSDILTHVLKAGAPVQVLKLAGVASDNIPDFVQIRQLSELVCLELSGRPSDQAATSANTNSTASVSIDDHLMSLKDAKTLRDLSIDGLYPAPADKFQTFVDIVVPQLIDLKTLYIDKLSQRQSSHEKTGIDPIVLAKLVNHPNLENIFCLKDLTEEFLQALEKLPKGEPSRSLRSVFVFYESSTRESLHKNLKLLAKAFPHIRRLSLNLNQSISAHDVLATLEEAKAWPGLDWRDVVVEQIALNVNEIAQWVRGNLTDDTGFKIRWKGLR